jgi:HlyD family secretion protein
MSRPTIEELVPKAVLGRIAPRLRAVFALGLLAIAGIYAIVSSVGAPEGEAPASVPLVLAPGSLQETVVGTGTVQPALQVMVKSEVAGIVERLDVEAGQRVAAGQVIAVLDPTRLQAQRDELRAAVEVGRNLALEDLEGLAATREEEAQREGRRAEELARRGVVSPKEQDAAHFALKAAQLARLNAGRQMAARRSELERLTRSLERLERDLERLVIRAPFDGVVLERPVERGSPVADVSASNGGTLIAVLADDSALHLVAEVDENYIPGIRIGQRAEVHVDALRDETLEGKVSRIVSSGRFERGATVFDVEVALPADPRLRVGMSADARVIVDVHRDVLVVPNDAIVRGDDGPRVRRRSGSNASFEWVAIQEGYSDGRRTVVASGLRAGDTLLVPSSRREP